MLPCYLVEVSVGAGLAQPDFAVLRRGGSSAFRLSDGEHGIQSKMKNVGMHVWATGAQGSFELLVASQELQAQMAVDFSRTGRVWKSLQGLALAARSR